MRWFICVGIFFICLANHVAYARNIPEGVPYDEPPAVPYWPYSTSDFWRYVEYFRTIGAYKHIDEMARTFFAHQPLGDTLGFEVAQQEP